MRPLKDDLPPEALRVLARATRRETVHGGCTMVWHCWSPGGQGGRPLVLLHGGSGSWTHWIRNVEALAAAGWQVCVPDLPGFGDSQVVPDASDAPDLVDTVAHGIGEIAGGKPCVVVGFSFGALTGVLVAAAKPGVIERLVIVGGPGLGLRSQRLALRGWLGLDDAQQRNDAHRHNLQVLMLHRPDSIDDVTVAIHAANLVRDRMRKRGVALTDIVLRTLPSLSIRLDAIYGEEDALYAGQMDEVERLLRSAPGFVEMVRIQGAGHWVQYEDAAAFNASLLRVLA